MDVKRGALIVLGICNHGTDAELIEFHNRSSHAELEELNLLTLCNKALEILPRLRTRVVSNLLNSDISADVDFITLGQYLQPTTKHAAVADFVTPEQFAEYAATARAKGFLMVSATPLTRSSYHADADFAALRAARAATA